MPQNAQHAPHREHLHVAQNGSRHHTLSRHHVEGVKSRLHRLYPTLEMSSPQTPIIDVSDPLQREVAVRVGRAWREIRRGASMSRLIEYLFGAGDDALEIGQMDTLDLLVQQPAWRMGDLAEALRVDPSTATRAVQRLERVGLAARCGGLDDKRVVMVSASDAGRLRHGAAAARREELMNHIMSSFGQGELEKLASTLEQFIGAIDGFVDDLHRHPPADEPG